LNINTFEALTIIVDCPAHHDGMGFIRDLLTGCAHPILLNLGLVGYTRHLPNGVFPEVDECVD